MLSGRGLCDELITRPGESYRVCCVVVCDLDTSRMGAPYICDISRLTVKVSFRNAQTSNDLEVELLPGSCHCKFTHYIGNFQYSKQW